MSDPIEQPEPRLPGYELIEKIGAGGYGEVWSAVAPGGLRKAVKYVFGNEFDKRAKNELHSLEKVKSVRHPFLLSLERIEIIDGRLIVVSELADGSLRDRFCDCVRQGLPGIPREELLGYLADAADALDFISREHDLAHLDIKPENLLLVAGHVKVADFGLVKSVASQTQVSLVGGMTPTYAAPEVFRGAPGRQSDQYSLAILYQEMLTGSVPFPGANAAELTLQHMNDDPDLSRLGEGDRFAVSRGLAKDPAHRYESARAMVEAIRSADHSTPSFSAGPAPEALSPRQTVLSAESKLDRHSATEVFSEPGVVDDRAASSALVMSVDELDTPTPQEVAPPEVDLGQTPFEATPSLFIGIGSTGARVLRALRGRVDARLGNPGPIASAPMLLLDTNSQTLAAATRNEGLEASETISLPLRRPQAYRDKSEVLLRWLGRRWLYNIPRSLQTESIRPLGRLALVDHARQTFQRIRGVVTEAVDPLSRQAASDATGLPFTGDGLRVYVVAASSGGAGSGMSIDVAYAVRAILERIGVEKAKIIGLVTHSTSRDAKRIELARVNSYAWLSEFEQFRSSVAGYPGDDGVGLPEHEPGVAPFDHTYFLPLGEQMDTPAFEAAADTLADYLYADAFTTDQKVLDACRGDRPDERSTLRSFAVWAPGAQNEAPLTPAQQAAVSRMLDQWLGGDEPTGAASEPEYRSTDQVVHGAVAFLGKTQLDSSTLAANCRSLLEASLGGDASAYVEAKYSGLDASDVVTLAASINSDFGIEEPGDAPASVGENLIEDVVKPIAAKLKRDCVDWVLARVNDTQERLVGAERAAQWLIDYVGAIGAELDRVEANVAAERERWIEGWTAADPREAPGKLFLWRLDEAAIEAARRVAEAINQRVASLPGDLDGLRAVVSELKRTLTDDALAADVATADANALAVAIEQRMQADYLTRGGLFGALSEEDAATHVAATITHVAHLVARDTTSSSNSQKSADAGDASYFPEPPLDSYGGVYRRLSLASPTAEGDAPSGGSSVLVTEMEGVSLRHVAADLIGRRRDYAAFAERVRTRRDIPWIDPVTGNEGRPDRPSTTTTAGATTPLPTGVGVPADASATSPPATAVLG